MAHHILIVDDDRAIREVLAMVLKDEGFDVDTAANGPDALEQIGRQRPVLVLLDLQMPGMAGWEVLEHLREARVDVPVLFMSAGYRAKAAAEQYRADGYLAKPFELDELLAVVKRFVGE